MSKYYATVEHEVGRERKRFPVPFFIDFSISILVVTLSGILIAEGDYHYDATSHEIVFPDPPQGDSLLIRRKTLGEERVLEFLARGRLMEANTNLDSNQLFCILQELYDEIILKGEVGDIDLAIIEAAIAAHNRNPASHAVMVKEITRQVKEATLTALAAHNVDPNAHPNLRSTSSPADKLPIGGWFGWGGRLPIPEDYILCEGAAINREDHPKLFEALGTTYGPGDGSTTFNVPDFRGDFIRGYRQGVTAERGVPQPEGLPNITGTHSFQRMNDYQGLGLEGCFDLVTPEGYHGLGRADNDNAKVKFDASRSNPIYGASQHVTPVNEASYLILKAVTRNGGGDGPGGDGGDGEDPDPEDPTWVGSIIVSGAGSSVVNGVYTIVDATKTGTERKWQKGTGANNVYVIEWMSMPPGSPSSRAWAIQYNAAHVYDQVTAAVQPWTGAYSNTFSIGESPNPTVTPNKE